MEDRAFNIDIEATMELSILRRDIIAQRVVMFPIRTLTMEMRNKLNRFSRVELTTYIDDLIDHLNKICETLDECKEVIEVFKDTDYTLATQRLNRVIRILNVFAIIVLPFLAISSLYGMNVGLPGGIEGGGLETFLILLAVMVVITIGVVYYFRRRHWI